MAQTPHNMHMRHLEEKFLMIPEKIQGKLSEIEYNATHS
jgi:hypothetical protein